MRYIYALHEEDGDPVYIGETGNPFKRLVEHMCDAVRIDTPKAAWIRSLILWGDRPHMTVLHTVSDDHARSVEYFEMTKYFGRMNPGDPITYNSVGELLHLREDYDPRHVKAEGLNPKELLNVRREY